MPGWFYLNTDASVQKSGEVAIGAVLRQRVKGTLVVKDYITRRIRKPVKKPVMGIHEAEYRALIEGLKLAQLHDPLELHVYSDRAPLVKAVYNEESPPEYKMLHKAARELIEGFDDRVWISFVPREMNIEADQRAADAFVLPLSGGTGKGGASGAK